MVSDSDRGIYTTSRVVPEITGHEKPRYGLSNKCGTNTSESWSGEILAGFRFAPYMESCLHDQ